MTTRTLMSTQTARWAAGTVMVVGGLMATISGMNAWAAAPAVPQTAAASGAAAAPAASAPQGAPHGMRHGGHHHHGKSDMKGTMKMGGPMMGGAFPMGGRGMERMLKDLKATDAQRAQIKQIAEAARTDLGKLHADHGKLHEQALSLLTQPKIDTAATEKLRQQMLAHHDTVSKRMMTAMVEAAQVLTPEQRSQLAQKLKARQERREGRHNGRHE
jgi:Spy/CpxP family protein refolding chaperone